MNPYIKAQDVDDKLGTGWEGDGDKDRAVLESNAYMTTQGVQYEEGEPVADDIITAGAYLAKAAAEGNLYVTNDGRVESESVQAEGVSVSTSFQSGSAPANRDVSLARDLLRPYITGASGGNQFTVSRA